MYPEFQNELTSKLPSDAKFRTPKPSEIDEEGFGNFQDVIDLRGTTVEEAQRYLASHLRVLDFIHEHAITPESFEEHANAFEAGGAGETGLSGVTAGQLDRMMDSYDCDLGGLELGVGALAYALSAAKIFPAASCRSHNTRSWAPYPVVYFASNRSRAELLQELVDLNRCGFETDPNRPDLLVVAASSLVDLLALTHSVVDNLAKFRSLTTRSNAIRKTRPVAKYVQTSLLDD